MFSFRKIWRRMHAADQPLEVEVKRNVLVISIGINTLAWAAEHCPDWYDQNGDAMLKVLDNGLFAQEVAHELRREEEDGTTPVHLLLDSAIGNAVENGAEYVRLSGDDK